MLFSYSKTDEKAINLAKVKLIIATLWLSTLCKTFRKITGNFYWIFIPTIQPTVSKQWRLTILFSVKNHWRLSLV